MTVSQSLGNAPKALVFVLGRRPEHVIGASQQLVLHFADHLPVIYVMADRMSWRIQRLFGIAASKPWDKLVPSERLQIISQVPEPPGMSYNASIRKVMGALTAARIRQELVRSGWQESEVAFFIYHPEPANIVRHFPMAYWHYHCIDDFINWHGVRPGVGKLLGGLERYLGRYSDSVSATSKALLQRMESEHSSVLYCPNGVEVDHFILQPGDGRDVPADMAKIPRPIIGFVGATPGYIDVQLVQYAIDKRPDYSFVFVGPLKNIQNRLRDANNVYFLGTKPYEGIANYMHAFDVCLLPASRNQAAIAQNTGKQHQYMATGKPIVAVDMPEIDDYRDLMYVSSTKDDFVSQLDLALSDPPDNCLKRIDRARMASWSKRAEDLMNVILADGRKERTPAFVDARRALKGI